MRAGPGRGAERAGQGGTYLQAVVQQAGGERRAVQRAAPGAGQPHRMVRVHVRQEEQPRAARPPHAPEVHGDGRAGDHRAVHGAGLRGARERRQRPRRFPPNSARGTAHAREGRGGACAARGGAERAAMPYLGGEEALRDLRRALSNPHVQAEPLRYRAAVLRVIRCGAVRCGGRRREGRGVSGGSGSADGRAVSAAGS